MNNVSPENFRFIADMLRAEAAITLETGKEYLVETRLQQVVRQSALHGLDELIGLLRKGDLLLKQKVVEAMTTNETSFFRDIHPFDALKNELIRRLVPLRLATKKITIWSAASSTGQEPYSIAMVLSEVSKLHPGYVFEVVATDLSTEVLARAESGIFTQPEVNRGLPAPYLVKYFERNGLDWRVRPEVRKLVSFRKLNLIQDWVGIPMCDIVFMRNVLIYFDIHTKRTILSRVKRTLRPDGYLLLGGAETTLNIHDGYERTVVGKATCYVPLKESRP